MKLGQAEARVEHAIKNVMPEADGQAAYDTSVLGRQPHQTFLIDGPKGSGKSTLLLNLRCALEQVGPRELIKPPLTAFPFKGLEVQFPEHFEDLTDFQALSVAGKTRKLVHALPVIKPDAMETSESIIESVFAEMTGQFEFVENSGRQGMSASDWPDQTSQFNPRIQRAEQLKKELHSEVAKGRYFARQLGVEALMNDSMNFDEYITRRASEAVVSHKRVSRWMKYVSAYLDFFDAELLAIFVDDTDVSSDLTADILHTIRMFFCHPRIVVLMAGNLHTMRQRLLARAMSEQSDAHRALRAGNSFTAKFWRDFERDNLEEYFSKVLPVGYRHFISASGPDTEHLLSTQTFVKFCGSQMNSRMEEFLKERRTTRMRNEGDAQIRSARYEQLLDLAQQENRFHVESENHIALWLLRNHYAKVLTPKTARHLNQFREMVERKAEGSGQKSLSDSLSSSRRVVVALFTQPNNYTIIQRQSDFDNDALLWINRQPSGRDGAVRAGSV